MSGQRAPMPRWAQALLVPAVLVAVWVLGQTIGHALFVFVTSVVIALLLNPLVRQFRRLRVPRGLAVLLVFLSFLAIAGGGVFLVIDPVRGQIEDIQSNIPAYTDQAQRQAQSLQDFFDEHGWDVNVRQRANAAIEEIQQRFSAAAEDFLSYGLDVLSALVTFVIILVASIYMLLDAPRIARFAQRVGGPGAGAFLRRTERTLIEYVKAQMLVSAIIGVSAGAVLWIYGVTGVFELGATYAVAFAAWVFVMEFVPYVGPILGAVPPTLLALFTSPLTALWVVFAFIGIHQLEGHIVVPKIFGGALGVHPLVVIFGLLVGGELYGVAGVLLAIPMVVIAKEAVVFVTERTGFARWESEHETAVPASPPPAAPDQATTPAPVVTQDTPTDEIAIAAVEPPVLRAE
jgi:predicted PurR-regulated permease PerM